MADNRSLGSKEALLPLLVHNERPVHTVSRGFIMANEAAKAELEADLQRSLGLQGVSAQLWCSCGVAWGRPTTV